MSDKYTDTNCKLHGTAYCHLLNQTECNSCYVSKLSDDEQYDVMEDIGLIAVSIPADGFEDIMNRDECMLCKGDKKGKTTGYAQLNLGHANPKVSDTDSYKSKRYKRDVSMTIPIQLPVCKRCSRLITMFNLLPFIVGVIMPTAGLIIVSIESIRSELASLGAAVPFLIFLISIFMGVIADTIVKAILTRRIERSVLTRPSRIEGVCELIKNGWFAISNPEGGIRYTFSKRPMKSGILTGANRREDIAAILGTNATAEGTAEADFKPAVEFTEPIDVHIDAHIDVDDDLIAEDEFKEFDEE